MNEMTVANNTNNMMVQDASSFYSSMPTTTPADKLALYNAINSPEERLGDHINETITVVHVVAQMVEMTNERVDKATGEKVEVRESAPRIILIDDKGKTFACVSMGIYGALKNLFSIYGEPQTWEKPLKFKVKQITKGQNKMLSLEMVAK
jgi:hypothetical protein